MEEKEQGSVEIACCTSVGIDPFKTHLSVYFSLQELATQWTPLGQREQGVCWW